MFSFQTSHVRTVRIAKIFAKISYYVANAFVFFWNLAILFSNSSLGSEKVNQNRHSLIKSRLTDLNNFIRKRVTAKSNDFTSLLFNGQHSKPYNKIGKHFHLHLTNLLLSHFDHLRLFVAFFQLFVSLRYVNPS